LRSHILSLLAAAACHPCDRSLLDYAPLDGDWPVSTPEEVGLERDLLDGLYCDAQREDTLYGLLVAKDGQLVAEDYYGDGGIDERSTRQSVTKSFNSALVGLAVEQGCLSIDDKMFDYFPEYVGEVGSEKRSITIEDMLQMRSGYPWEETDPALWDGVLSGDYEPLVVDFPLTEDPGTVHQYSNLTAHWLGVIVARACDVDLYEFAESELFAPLGAELGGWLQDADGYWMGAFWMQITARDMARFGQMYLDDGRVGGDQVLPASWVRDSLKSYSEPTGALTPGPELRDWGYGYQWWSGRAKDNEVDFAWGHGGNFIFLVEDLDLMVVITADPFLFQHDNESWKHEKSLLNMGADFLSKVD
jgi:CubicO group peptidase (beta-lactamase class C family)